MCRGGRRSLWSAWARLSPGPASRRYLEDVADSDLILFVDAYDVMMLRPAADVERLFRQNGARLIVGGEKNCAPDPALSLLYSAEALAAPLHYLNSGTYIGYASDIKVGRPSDGSTGGSKVNVGGQMGLAGVDRGVHAMPYKGQGTHP